MTELHEQVYQFIKVNGPVIPVQISKVINSNIIFASAILAELYSSQRLKMSNAVIGSSKLYYIPGQEGKLFALLQKYLKEKERQAVELLISKKVLREREMEPWQRAALRDMKDFAVALTVKHDDNSQEVFWKFHMVRDEEAKSMIQNMVDVAPAVIDNFAIEEPEEIVFKEPIVEIKSIAEIRPIIREEIKPVIKEEPIKEVEEESEEEDEEEEEEEEILVAEKPSGNFYNKIKRYLEKQGLDIVGEETIKKGKEFDFIINIQTGLGPLRYYIKSKDKKAINEADLSLTVSEAKHKNLPGILLSNGKLTKKAIEFMNTRIKNQILFKKI